MRKGSFCKFYFCKRVHFEQFYFLKKPILCSSILCVTSMKIMYLFQTIQLDRIGLLTCKQLCDQLWHAEGNIYQNDIVLSGTIEWWKALPAGTEDITTWVLLWHTLIHINTFLIQCCCTQHSTLLLYVTPVTFSASEEGSCYFILTWNNCHAFFLYKLCF